MIIQVQIFPRRPSGVWLCPPSTLQMAHGCAAPLAAIYSWSTLSVHHHHRRVLDRFESGGKETRIDFLQSRPANDPPLVRRPSQPALRSKEGGWCISNLHTSTIKSTSTQAQMREGGVLANLLNPPDRAISDGPAHLRDRLGSGNENETNWWVQKPLSYNRRLPSWVIRLSENLRRSSSSLSIMSTLQSCKRGKFWASYWATNWTTVGILTTPKSGQAPAEQSSFLRTCATHPTVIEVWAARKLGMVRSAPIIVGGGARWWVSKTTRRRRRRRAAFWSIKFSFEGGWFTDCHVCEPKFLI